MGAEGATTAETQPFSSESVTEGHPDKIADQISDAVLDAILAEDPKARVACETLVTTGLVFVTGEISTEAENVVAEIPAIARGVLREIGYTSGEYGIHGEQCSVLTTIDRQSPDIAMGVDDGGAGDQGMMFGYATDETDERMPLPIMLAHKLVRRLTKVRKCNNISWLRPDGKSQVSVDYRNGDSVRIGTVVVSAQHDAGVESQETREAIRDQVILPVLREDPRYEGLFDEGELCILVNPTGRFVEGGPHGDAGLTGRKIIVDTYGGMARHGGGAFSGKDPSKVDRSAAYAARWIAKNLVAAGLARRAEVQLAYAIGVAKPVSVNVNSFGTGAASDAELAGRVTEVFDLRPNAIIDRLGLRAPIYRPTAAYGHFGREPEGGTFTWERTDRADDLA